MQPAAESPTEAANFEYLGNLPSVKSAVKWDSKDHDGAVLETDHYRLYTTLTDPMSIRQVPAFLESAYIGYKSQLPRPMESPHKFDVYLFENRSQWETFTKGFVTAHVETYLKIQKGAYYLNGACVAYNIGLEKTLSALGHEGWHHFASRMFIYRLPSWLDEGMAVMFETFSKHNGRFRFHPEKNSTRIGYLKLIQQQGAMIPLEQLISLNPGQVIDDNRSVLAYYSQVYALIRFLKEDNNGRYAAAFSSMLGDAATGKWPLKDEIKNIASNRNITLTTEYNERLSPQLFKYYIGFDLESIEQKYEIFCGKMGEYVVLKREFR